VAPEYSLLPFKRSFFHSLISADAATSLEQTQHQTENKAVSVAPFLGALKIAKTTLGFVISVRLPAWNISAPTRRIFVKFYI
jgi:hypothetical protein